MSEIIHLPAADRQVRRWKNGGGTTTDIAVYPADAGLDDFDWRISMASVATAGPFSNFGAVDRILAVLKGQLQLAFEADGTAVALDPDSLPLRFPGDVSVVGTPVGSAIQDLNLMTRRGSWTGDMARVAAACVLRLPSAMTTLFFSDAGRLRSQSNSVTVRSLDAVQIIGGPGEPVEWVSDGPVYLMYLSPVER